ncbi:MAG: hypothetical protein KC587_11905 [Nitrospira sp.]|nr:hypothetical protein [Nitrospira sp.]
MKFPQPLPGLVVCFSYLWRGQKEEGWEEGIKDRPCAIVAAIQKKRTDEKGEAKEQLQVSLIPITTSQPKNLAEAVEIPPATRKRLGLAEDKPCWAICSEINTTDWPGYDLRPVPGTKPPRFEYGFLPPTLLRDIQEKVSFVAQGKKLKVVSRNENL